MNRTTVILLCITTLAIYYILSKKPQIDIEKYEETISSLQLEIEESEKRNDSLRMRAFELEKSIAAYDVVIESYRNDILEIKKDAQDQLDAVDNFGDHELERFFAERYKRLYHSPSPQNNPIDSSNSSGGY